MDTSAIECLGSALSLSEQTGGFEAFADLILIACLAFSMGIERALDIPRGLPGEAVTHTAMSEGLRPPRL